jgi:hypothetical protein
MVTNLFREDFLEIFYDEEDQWLHADWRGYQTDTSVKAGVNSLIDLLAQHQAAKILNDNTRTLGIWMENAPWLVFDALPRARKAGLKAFAHVYGPSRFSRVSADAALFLLKRSNIEIRAFEDVESAKKWLRSVS